MIPVRENCATPFWESFRLVDQTLTSATLLCLSLFCATQWFISLSECNTINWGGCGYATLLPRFCVYFKCNTFSEAKTWTDYACFSATLFPLARNSAPCKEKTERLWRWRCNTFSFRKELSTVCLYRCLWDIRVCNTSFLRKELSPLSRAKRTRQLP